MIGEIIAVVSFLWLGGNALFGKTEEEPEPPASEEIDYLTMSAHIRKLNQTMEQINTLDRMITDIEICDPSVLQKSFSCSWQSGGDNRNYQFWTSGADVNADHLLQMAADEREQLRASLLEQIDRIYAERWRQNGDKTHFSAKKITEGEGLSMPALDWEEAESNAD